MQTNSKHIFIIAKDFSSCPGGRAISTGDYSAELLYTKHLKPLFRKIVDANHLLLIDLDGTQGYAISFLDEVFGRFTTDFTQKEMSLLKVKSNEDPELLAGIQDCVKEWFERGPHPNSPLSKINSRN